ncbi:MAG: inorganic diphosphatase [Acidimicrobiales bacterium]
MDVAVFIEIPKGSRNKYEIDHMTNTVWLDRMLFTATVYPQDYGFIEHTLAEDGDALDALVLLDEPTFPGCRIRARTVAVFAMSDEKGRDVKVLCVPATDPRWAHIQDLTDIPPFQLEEIAHFFEVYKAIEPDKGAIVEGWRDAVAADAEVDAARERYSGSTH